MNEHDSARVKDLLLEDGYYLTTRPEEADILLFNTCSVRKHAEDRVFGVVGMLKKLKAPPKSASADLDRGGNHTRHKIIGVIGCMAEAQRDLIFRKLPHVNFLCGPADLDKIPKIIKRIRSGARHIICVEGARSKRIPEFSRERPAGKASYVKIMEGCSNFCSYCIVPYVRGQERSRPSKEILDEVRGLVDKGTGRITLLGQNVNSYGKGLREKVTFPGLLRKIDNSVKGKAQIDFVTSHPKDADTDLFRAMADSKSILRQLHLPLQSGSNKILKKMNRGYTVERYKRLAKEFRAVVKGSTLTTDLMVGFPGEKEKDFKDTLDAVKEIRFDAAFVFKYSPRPFVAASKFKDDVPEEKKKRRHALLLETQKKISVENREMSVVFLVGPTASGKTALSIKLARRLDAEIISCDSMCVYKGLDVLSSKPTRADRKKVRHHLIDIISPTREFSVAEYRRLALEAVEDILDRGKIPLFVGGSGLYVKAVVDGLFPSGKKDKVFRTKQEGLAKRYGKAYLYKKLKRIDPVGAKKIHPNNLRRVIRAMEIYHTEGKRPSELRKGTVPIKHKVKIFGLRMERDRLYRNIDKRVESMFKEGIVQEVKRLSRTRLSVTARKALGYKEILGYLKGRYSLEEAKALLKKNTRRFAKRQLTWFRVDERIEWTAKIT